LYDKFKQQAPVLANKEVSPFMRESYTDVLCKVLYCTAVKIGQ